MLLTSPSAELEFYHGVNGYTDNVTRATTRGAGGGKQIEVAHSLDVTNRVQYCNQPIPFVSYCNRVRAGSNLSSVNGTFETVRSEWMARIWEQATLHMVERNEKIPLEATCRQGGHRYGVGSHSKVAVMSIS